MKIGMDELREMSESAARSAGEEAAGEVVEEAAEEAVKEPTKGQPTMGLTMGPEGTQIDVDAPLEDMGPKEAIEFAQSLQQPSATEQLVDLVQQPEVQHALKQLWYGPEDSKQNQAQPQQQRPQPQPQEMGGMPDPSELIDEPNEETAAEPETMSENPNQNQAEPQQQMSVDVPEGMDEDRTYEILSTVLSALAEEHPELTPDELVFISRVMFDVTHSIGNMKPGISAEEMNGMADRFEGRIKSELSVVIDGME